MVTQRPCHEVARGSPAHARRRSLAHAVAVILSTAAVPALADPGVAGTTEEKPQVAAASVPRTIEPVTRPEPAPGEPPANREPAAADLAGAPAAGDESGRIDPGSQGDSALQRALRGALFGPKVAANLLLSPVRLSVWAYDRYRLDDLYYRVFFNDTRTIGLVPTVSFDSWFGITAGARFVDRDVLGAREHLSIEAGGGGRYRQVYKVVLRSGERLGKHIRLELDGQYELRPKDPFYGIGDNDGSSRPAAPVDPNVVPVAVETRYRERIARVAGLVDVRLIDSFHVRGASELTDRTFSASDAGIPIDAVYDPAMIVGYSGVRYLYSELELRFDSRRRSTRFEPRPLYSAGSLAAVFGGRIHRVDGAPHYWRGGVDLQHFVRLADGPRVLAMRLRGEAVSGSRSEVPFTELPQLGGADELRGYPADRFRDRVLTLGSIEYEWDLSALVSASLFVDAGRVFASLDDLSADRMRVGYGLAFQAHTENSFGFQGSLASSIDGGLFFNLSFNSVFALAERVKRR